MKRNQNDAGGKRRHFPLQKLDEMKRAEEERFSGLQSEIRSIFEKAFSEQWELMKHTITNDWKTSTKEVLQVIKLIWCP